jgi:hypothetical protein
MRIITAPSFQRNCLRAQPPIQGVVAATRFANFVAIHIAHFARDVVNAVFMKSHLWKL